MTFDWFTKPQQLRESPVVPLLAGHNLHHVPATTTQYRAACLPDWLRDRRRRVPLLRAQ